MSGKIKCKAYKPGLQFKYAHAKLDGFFVTVSKYQGVIRVETSGFKMITDKVRTNWWFGTLHRNMREGDVIYGELWLPGQPAANVPSALAAGSELSFSCFATQMHDPAMPIERLNSFITLELRVGAPEFYFVPNEDCDTFLQDNRMPQVGEGWVFKNGNRLDWAKWKPSFTVDCVVTGYTYGKGQYEGLVGSIMVSVFDDSRRMIELANVSSGIDASLRQWITDHQTDFLGAVVEIEYQLAYKGGGLRHPRFVRVREDKLPLQDECHVNQVNWI